jgi:mxaJ protein
VKSLIAVFVLCAGTTGAVSAAPLVVCADPHNLPFSDRDGEGFENKIIERVAKDLGREVEYVWWAQRRGYVRKTLNQAKCDIWPGVATGMGMVASSRPYYRSSYVFVTRAADPLNHLTLDDSRLRASIIGVQMIGNDAMNTPPAHAIAARGIIENVRGYMVYGDSSRPNPSATILDAVAKNEIDVAIVWGPEAGYYAKHSQRPLRIDIVTPASDARWPMTYDISMGVRRDNSALLSQVNTALDREAPAILAILRAYHVPLAAGALSSTATISAN